MDMDPPLPIGGPQGNDLEDAIMNGPGQPTAEDLEPVPSCHEKFCFLCKYGGADNTVGNVNVDAKRIEQGIGKLRKSLGVFKTAQYIKTIYEETIAGNSPFDEEDEWELDTIVEHICSHAAPEATARGENASDVAYEVFSGLLLFQSKHMLEKETGLIDSQALKSLCGIADRMYKFTPKRATTGSGGGTAASKRRDDDF